MNNKIIQNTLQLLIFSALFGVSVFAQKTSISTRWIPTSVYGAKIADTKAFIELNNDENRLAGNAGCNRMLGSFEKNGRNIEFSGIGTTKMFCNGANVMKREVNLLRALNETTKFTQYRNSLNFYAGRKLVATFKKETVSASVKLEDKKWILESIRGLSIPQTETEAFIVFDKQKGSAGGNTGCNSFGGDYTSKGANLKITGLISTMRACIEDEGMNVERKFTDALQKTDRFEIKNGKLLLYQGKNLLLTLRGDNK